MTPPGPRMRLTCILAPMLAAWLLAAAPAIAIATLAPPTFDAATEELVVPYDGHMPSYRLWRFEGPERVVFEFDATSTFLEPHRGWASGSLRGWSIERRDAQRVRLVLDVVGAPRLRLIDAATERHMRISLEPKPELAPLPALSEPHSPVVLASFAPVGEAIERVPTLMFGVLPVPGPTPPVAPPSPGALPAPAAGFTRAPAPLERPAPAAAFASRPHAVRPADRMAAPRAGAASIVSISGPGTLGRVDLGIGGPSYREHFPDGQMLAAHEAIRALGVRWEGEGHPAWLSAAALNPGWLEAPWFLASRFAMLAYGFQDAYFPVSIHARQELRTELSVTRARRWPWLHLHGGLGYVLRLEQAVHSGAPPTPSYAFAGGRVVHGPEIVVKARWPLSAASRWLSGWSVSTDGAFAPAVWSHVALDAATPPVGLGLRLAGALEYDFGIGRARLGFQRWSTHAIGYEEVFQGPWAELGW